MLRSKPSSGCLTSFSSPLLCPFAQALFFAPPLQVTFPGQTTSLDNSARLGSGVLSTLRPEVNKRRILGLLQCSGGGGSRAALCLSLPFRFPLPLLVPSALRSPVPCTPSSLCSFPPPCLVILSIMIVPNNTALGSVTNQKHPRLAQQRVKCNFEFKISHRGLFRESIAVGW